MAYNKFNSDSRRYFSRIDNFQKVSFNNLAMAFKLNRSRNEPMSEINVTPFVDVMLVLLIILWLQHHCTVGVQVDLPSSSTTLFYDQEPLTISINSKGEIYIQEHQVTYQKWFQNC